MVPDNASVSVVMSVYNEIEHVEESINSILSQDLENFEFIIIDDCSNDGTSDILGKYQALDNRINLIVNDQNLGLPASLNKGIKNANGRFIARQDADDRSHPERLSTQVKYLTSSPDTKAVGTNVRIINNDGKHLWTKKYSPGPLTPEKLKESGPGFAHGSVMMRRSAVERVCGYREEFKYAQDLDLWIRLAREFGPTFRDVIQDPLYELRKTPDQYDRKSVVSVYSNYAGEYVGTENDLQNNINNEIEEKKKLNIWWQSNEFAYYYECGWGLFENNRRIMAITHFLRAIFYEPLNIRGWYGFLLAFTPLPITEKIRKIF